MKILGMLVLVAVTSLVSVSAQTPTLTGDDLKALEGAKWTGNLTYLDYSSNKKVQIKADITVTRKLGDPNVWIFAYEYPDEPKMNGASEVTLADGGKSFNGGSVSEARRTTKGDTILFSITKPGTDNDRKAMFLYTYIIGKNMFTIRKDVKLDGTDDWFTRNEYSFSR